MDRELLKAAREGAAGCTCSRVSRDRDPNCANAKHREEAAMQLPRVIASNQIEIFGIKLAVHVLDNGQRIIEEGDFIRLMEAMADPNTKPDPKQVENFARAIKGIR